MFRRSKKENKSKLEHKLYLARETPEPVFDVSDCGIRNVPTGIYSLCRVFLKERLQLEKNNLSSLSGGGSLKDLHLLKVLDLRENSFSNIPDEIELLTNLVELHLNDNQIKKLPNALCNLRTLRVLEVAKNRLKCLPENIGNLTSLQTLNLLENGDLAALPKSLCRAQRVKAILASPETFVYPPPDTVHEGTEAIMKYICEDVGFTYIPPDSIEDLSQYPTVHEESEFDDHDGTFKEQRMQDFLEIERSNELQQRQEYEIAKAQKLNREKLLMDIAQEQVRFDSKLAEVQQLRDTERFQLIEQLFEVEQHTDLAINQLLTLNKEPLAQLLEQEKLEEERLLAATLDSNKTLRKQDVLNCMEELLEQEAEKFRIYDQNRYNTTQSVLEKEIQSSDHIADMLQNIELEKAELVTQLQKDVELQKVVVGALLERSDARCWGLTQEVNLVEAQLAALTQIELDRRKLQLEENVNDLAEKRANLSMLLMELLEQQDVRRTELLSTLRSMEQKNNDMQDFWLIQYQKLLDRMPSAITEAQRNIDPKLSHALLMAGVLQYLPFLASLAQKIEPSEVREEDIEDVGITNSEDRKRIVDAFHMCTKMSTTSPEHRPQPSAPQMADEASAPSPEEQVHDGTTECVICMEKQCTMVFVPCGHLCCCSGCSSALSDCPLCRSTIEHKIVVFRS